MSWLLVRGRILHCLKCGASIGYEYEGGARLTLVSEQVIQDQREVAKHIDQPTEAPLEDGWFLRDFGRCDACHKKLSKRQRDSFARLREVSERCDGLLRAAIFRVVERRAELLSDLLSDFDLETAKRLYPDAWWRTVGRVDFQEMNEGQRRSQIRFFAGAITPDFHRELHEAVKRDSAVNGIIAEIEPQCALLREEGRALLDIVKDTIWIRHQVGDIENLNPLLHNEQTSRVAVIDAPPDVFWIMGRLPREHCHKVLNTNIRDALQSIDMRRVTRRIEYYLLPMFELAPVENTDEEVSQ